MGINMDSKAQTILKEVYDKCQQIYGTKLCNAYLYGSYARGDFDKDSDIDFLLTVDMDNPEKDNYFYDIAKLSNKLSLDYDVTVSITVKSQNHFLKYSDYLPFYANVLKEGIRYVA